MSHNDEEEEGEKEKEKEIRLEQIEGESQVFQNVSAATAKISSFDASASSQMAKIIPNPIEARLPDHSTVLSMDFKSMPIETKMDHNQVSLDDLKVPLMELDSKFFSQNILPSQSDLCEHSSFYEEVLPDLQEFISDTTRMTDLKNNKERPLVTNVSTSQSIVQKSFEIQKQKQEQQLSI